LPKENNLPVLDNPSKLKAKEIKIFTQSKVYFLRRVKEKFNQYSVEILNIYINLEDKYAGQYVLAELDIADKNIKIYQEIKEKRNKGFSYLWRS